MQKHIKVYRDFFKIGDQDIPLCEVCTAPSVDIHHITSRKYKSFEWFDDTYDINDILNLIGLCRECHNQAHSNIITKNYLYTRHQFHILYHG